MDSFAAAKGILPAEALLFDGGALGFGADVDEKFYAGNMRRLLALP